MYIPDRFAETDPAVIDDLIRRARIGALVTHGPDGLYASHLPFLWDRERGVLTGHIARANPHRARAGDGEAMVMFRGADAYISPAWYPTKVEDPRQVPTWNYEAVHLSGRLQWIDDPARVLAIVRGLTNAHEAGREHPWSIEDAPAAYIDGLLRGIVGLELHVSRIEAKRKMSQHRPSAENAAVASVLARSADSRDREAAEAMLRSTKA